MQRKTARDFSPAVLELFDRYVHGSISRRDFLDRAGSLTAGGLSAAGLLSALSPNFAAGQQVPPDDSRLETHYIDIESRRGSGKVRSYLCRPASASATLPAVLVIHENRGLNPHIEDIARRVALDGFLAIAPDALTPLGGYPGSEDAARELFAQLDRAKTLEDFEAAAHHLRVRPDSNGRVGAVGFCYGGGVVSTLATRMLPDHFHAGVSFYGSAPPVRDVPRIRAPMQLHFASSDPRVNAGWSDYEAALRRSGATYEAHVYEGTQHGFNNDTTPRYDEAAASRAWSRTIEFFRSHLEQGAA